MEYKFINYYKCPDCKCSWAESWDSTCNSKCPSCGKEYSPYRSQDIPSYEDVDKEN